MALPGELKGFDGTTCENCGTPLKLEILRSAAGHYLGYFCPVCGPYSRETGYYGARAEAETELAVAQMGGTPVKARDTDWRR